MKRKIQKITAIFISVIISLSMIVSPVNAEEDIRVFLDGQKIDFDVPPQIINDYTMVPMRAIFEVLGYDVDWNDADKSITAVNGSNTIFMKLLSNEMTYNDDVITLDIAPMSINGRTLVPVRTISETSGYNVSWDGANRSVIIGDMPDISYYDASIEIEQINSFIEQGLYIEAVELCNNILSNYKLSQNDKSTINDLKNLAQTKYDEYSFEQSKWKEYYYDDWCIGFTGLASYRPTYFKGGDHIQVYNLGDSAINITSYKIGSIGDGGKLTSNINECAKVFEAIIDYSTDSIEIISETDTTAGALNAYQRTYRITEYTNRYQTKAEYQIIRHIVFKYGDWIYLIDAEQNKYIWDDDFYQLLEKVRTSILFR